MSYVYLVLKPEAAGSDELLLMEVPVTWTPKGFIATGKPVIRYTPESDMQNMLHGHEDDGHSMEDVDVPAGWQIASRLWSPKRYVPRSQEVRQHSLRESVDYMLGRGLITPQVAKQILEDNDA